MVFQEEKKKKKRMALEGKNKDCTEAKRRM